MNFYQFELDIKGDERGSLVAIEESKTIPFDIKRVYYIFNTKDNVARGKHAHKVLQQVLIAVSGSCKIKIFNGKNEEIFTLNKPNKALFVGRNLWREMFDFSNDCVLLVLADGFYDEKEYIRNFEEFLYSV